MLTGTAQRTAAEWTALLTESGVTGGDLFTNTIDGMDHPQACHNGNVIAVDDPEVGPSEQIGPVAKFGAALGSIGANDWKANQTRPTPGEHTDRRPLDGVLLLEAAAMIATPVGSCLLSDFGAAC